MKEKVIIKGQNEATNLRENEITLEIIKSEIEEILASCFDEEYIGELGGKWALLANNAASFWESGASLVYIKDEDDYEEIKLFTIEDYAESFLDIFTEGEATIKSMAEDIFNAIFEYEND